MKIRQGFVSNSSSSSFIVHLNKPINDITYEEFKDYLQLNITNQKCPYCDDKEKGALQLYEALLNAKLTDIEKFKSENTYEIILGDLCDMEHVEEAYNLMHDYDTHFFQTEMVKLANEKIVIIDLGV